MDFIYVERCEFTSTYNIVNHDMLWIAVFTAAIYLDMEVLVAEKLILTWPYAVIYNLVVALKTV